MAKIKYIYNTETCAYEPYKISRKSFLLNFFGLLSLTILLAIGLIYLYHKNFTPFKESKLKQQNLEILTEFTFQTNKLQETTKELKELQDRDDNVFRTLLEMERIPQTVRTAGVGGTNRFEDIESGSLKNKSFIISQYSKIDKLKGQIYIQTKSYDELVKALETKKKMWASRPAITPLSREDINRIGSGFRWRLHPIHKVTKFHFGLDIQADRGKPIYASGDGVIEKAYFSRSYGNVVYVNHDFGYETRYGHMSNFNVKEGDIVKRGDIIGFIGSTGWSTASHLHYEVLLNGEHVDPVSYLSKNLQPEEFERLIHESNSSDLILDF